MLLAVSGGSDSMALLEIAGLLAPELGLRLHVACIDHGVRAGAAAEIELVRCAAARWEADFHLERASPARDDEDTLRNARFALLRKIAASTGARFTLLGHTRDDQIETVLLRFLRGAGLGGLAGMQEFRPPLVRPLLSAKREDLRRLLRARGAPWAEDPTNLSSRYARGRLRTTVMPAIQAAFGRGALEHLLDVAPYWRRDEEHLEEEAARALAYASRPGETCAELDAGALAILPVAVRARLLRNWIVRSTGRAPGSRDVAAIERWLDDETSSTRSRRRGRLDLAGATLERKGPRLAIRLCDASHDSSQIVGPRVDFAPASDDPMAEGEEPARDDPIASGKAVLPPFGGRVRFPRNQDFSRENPQRCRSSAKHGRKRPES